MTDALAGFRVGITGDRRADEQAELLARRGAQVVHGPVMRTDLLTDADATAEATETALAAPIDVVVLTTGIGTRSWFGVAETAGCDDQLRVAVTRSHVVARGPKARGAALAHGVDVHWAAPGETSAEILEHLRDLPVAGRRVVVQRDGGTPLLARAIRALGAEIVDVPVYRWHRPHDATAATRLLGAAADEELDAVTFTCAYAVGSAFDLAPDPAALRRALEGPVAAVAVGPVTAAALHAHGVGRVVSPRRARLGAMVQALVVELDGRRRTLRHGEGCVRWQGNLLLHPDGTTATLTSGEARILRALVERAPAVVPKRVLAGPGTDAHAAEVAVARLRAKLGPLAGVVRTVPRRGYAVDLASGPSGPTIG
jgi:uroporphyrinogen-III synthase